ncbi:MAG: hypothetical protein ACI9MB_003089, partial [Verrucomicrobiales bacterium]
AADGTGHSLVVRNPNRLADDWRNWRASTDNGGTPGSGDSLPTGSIAQLRLSEVMFSTNAEGLIEIDWVEVHNTGTSSASLGNLFLASTTDFSDKVPLNATAGADSYLNWEVPFVLPPGGDTLTLFLVDSGDDVIDAASISRTSGRDSVQVYPAGSGEWYASASSTRSSANDPDRSEDIVINEIMYDTPSDHRNGEFIELFNRGSGAVDISGWRIVDGVNFSFPSGTSIASGGFLVVAADADWMSNVYIGIPVIGDFTGQLSDSGELVRLEDEWGNLADQVDYMPSGDWPELADGDGSSMELRHPDMDNASPSAWRDSDESQKSAMQTFIFTGTYQQLRSRGSADDYKELHFHLVGDAYVVLENISLRENGAGSNLLQNVTQHATNGSSASGWLCQGTHWASFVQGGKLHLISDGHGDNKANRAEIDCTGIQSGRNYELRFDARWISGRPRLIGQTWDHSVGKPFLIPIPNNLGTPGSANSRLEPAAPPAVSSVLHSPAVPRSSNPVVVTAKIDHAGGVTVSAIHRLDNSNANGAWNTAAMNDSGNNGDAVAGDGIHSVTITNYQNDNNVVQFYVRAQASGRTTFLPKLGPDRPAMWVVDNSTIPSDLHTERFVISQYDRDAISSAGHSSKYQFDFPRMSNHYHNATFISDEQDIYYNAELRKSGSPFTRDGGSGLNHGKWKLPGDRLFRGRRKTVIDPSIDHDDRLARYFLYQLGHPVNEYEFVRVVINGDGASVRDSQEPIANDFLNRNFEGGNNGTLLRIDDEWSFEDFNPDGQAPRGSRNADWSYKGTDSPIRYHSEWLMRSRETDYDYTSFVEFVNKVGTNSFTESQINRLIDRDLSGLNAAVRGYDGDWDTLTLNRGKNGYFYRKPDGLWMLVHWDGDRVFENSGETFLGNLGGVRNYFNNPAIRRSMNYYMTELLEKHTRGSARTAAWLAAEEASSGSYSVSSKYVSWFSSRESNAENFIGEPLNASFAVSTQATHPNPEVDLTVGIPFVNYADAWDFNDQNINLGSSWREPNYNYSHNGWTTQGGSNIGGLYGFETSGLPSPGLRTPMLNSNDGANHITYYLRKEFEYSGALNGVTVTIDQVVDDGATYYLNGEAIGGAGVGANPDWKTTASRTVGDADEERGVVVTNGANLVDGTNLLAAEVHQTNSSSSDCIFGARLSISAPLQPSLVINEVLPTAAGGFVEFYNPTGASINLNGFYISDTPGDLTNYEVTQNIVIPSMGLGSVGYTQSSLSPGAQVAVYLTDADGVTIVNAIDTTMPTDGRSLGREPDGSTNWLLFASPTRDAANSSGPTSASVITLNGTAPSGVFEVRVVDHPEAEFQWLSTTEWTLVGINLASGQNVFDVEGVDREGDVVEQSVFAVTKTGNSPPSVVLDSNPNSLNLGVGEVLQLDSTGSFDPEGGLLTTGWSVEPTSNVTLVPAGATATASFARPGLYEFTITATDDQAQVVSATREAAVYNEIDFNSFAEPVLDDNLEPVNLEPRDNYSPTAWFSLEDKPGRLLLQVYDDSAKPFVSSDGNYPVIRRDLPAETDWSMHTDISLETLQFGDFDTGLIVRTNESGVVNRYTFGIHDGDSLGVRRAVGGSSNTIISVAWTSSKAKVRILRDGNLLKFENRVDDEWDSVHTIDLPAGTTVDMGGLFTTTDTPQSLRTAFDFLLVVDPETTSQALDSLRLTELMYHPNGGELLEFVELTNINTGPINVEGVRFENTRPFDELVLGDMTLAAGESGVVVADSATFVAEYGAGIKILGQWPGGRLSNGGERIVLRDPLNNAVHDFQYDDANGWPIEADGGGSSLEVIDVDGDYNDPTNWRASAPGGTPGEVGDDGTDRDNDGLTDTQETALGTDPDNPDSDGDGMLDGAEVSAGTSPLDARSVFVISAVGRDPGTGAVTATWASVAGKTYKLQVSTDLTPASWQDVTGGESILSQGTSTTFTDTEASFANTVRYYRAFVLP